MAEYDNRVRTWGGSAATAIDAGLRAYMLRVYNYMLLGLALTGAAAWFTASTPAFANLFFQETVRGYTLSGLGWVVLLAPLGIALLFRFRIQQMSFSSVQAVYWIFAALMGVGLTPVLLLYTGVSVAKVFFISAAMFGGLSLYGYTTNADLSGVGAFMRMGLWGLIIAMVVNAFLGSPAFDWALSIIGVVVFAGLTASNTQTIKEIYYVGDDGSIAGKKAVMGALTLYLDFINMFLFLFRLMGDRR